MIFVNAAASCTTIAPCSHAPSMTSHIVFQHPERLWLASVGAVIVMVLLLRSYLRASMAGPSRATALLCKLLASLLLLACVMDPQLVTETPRTGENELVVLVDNSASIDIAENQLSRRRGDNVLDALSDGADRSKWPAWLEKLRAVFRVRLQAVDARTRSITDATALDFKGKRSALSQSIQSARDRSGSAVAAVIAISDGNASDASLWTKPAPTGAPVFPVLVGESAPARDLSLTDVTALQSTFEDAPVQITARVSQHGCIGEEIELRVLDESGKELVKEAHRFTAEQTNHVFRPRVAAVKPGVSFMKVTVSVPRSTIPEATLANNERFITIDRGTGPYRVLYVTGRPNWEYKFMRRALALDPELQLPSIIRIARREPKFDFRGRPGESSNPLFRGFAGAQAEEGQRYDQPVLIRLGTKDKAELVDGFPKSADKLMAEYRAIVIDDLEAAFFTQEQMNLIEAFVSARGGTLLMLGGIESFQTGGYDNTPVGRMLPVYLDKIAQAGPIEDVKFNLTREGWLEPWTRLRAEQSQDETRIAQMPAFWSVNASRSIKPGAIVLANATDAQQQAWPALVTQRYGSGRAVALTIGDIWRWGMTDPEQHADMDKAWRQLVRWLVVDVPDRIETRTPVADDRASVEVRVRDAAFAPQDDAAVQIDIQPPSPAKPSTLIAEPSIREPGRFDADYYPGDNAGGYRIKAIVKDADGHPLGEKNAGFVLNPMAEEMAVLAPNRAFMQRVAEDTGGQLLALRDIAQLADLLPKLQMPSTERKAVPLWHNAWWLGSILALLITEWILRRRSGIV